MFMVFPLLTHWSYHCLLLKHQNVPKSIKPVMFDITTIISSIFMIEIECCGSIENCPSEHGTWYWLYLQHNLTFELHPGIRPLFSWMSIVISNTDIFMASGIPHYTKSIHGRDLYLVKPTLGPTPAKSWGSCNNPNSNWPHQGPNSYILSRGPPTTSQHCGQTLTLEQHSRDEYYTADSLGTLFEAVPEACMHSRVSERSWILLSDVNVVKQIQSNPIQSCLF